VIVGSREDFVLGIERTQLMWKFAFGIIYNFVMPMNLKRKFYAGYMATHALWIKVLCSLRMTWLKNECLSLS